MIKNDSSKGINHSKAINLKKFLFPLLIVVAILGIGGSYYYYVKYKAIKNNPSAQAHKETEALVRSVGKLMELPTGETPTMATILDVEKLKDQPFFKNAQNGDQLFVYVKAMKAILYRPSTNKIIDVAPLSPQPSATDQPPLSPPPK